jgi:hypothetical protein
MMDLDVPFLDDAPVIDWTLWGEQATVSVCEVKLSLDGHDARESIAPDWYGYYPN